MIYAFGEYELDLPRYELRRAGTPVKLEPQVFNILAYLIQHRDRIVTKEELLEQLWQGRVVGEAALTSRLTAARRAVGDRGREQRLIQTLHGRGYRFIAPVQERIREQAPYDVPAALPKATAPPSPLRVSMSVQAVGREAELAQLHRWRQRALRGTRQLVFVAGEAGLGKTTLVEMFLHDVGGPGALQIGRGQCIEHYGPGEAYLPVLEALGGLCKEPGGQELIALLARQAPTWVVHMPWLVADTELEALQRRVVGATRERMLREMGEALAVWAAERPLILVLEDLHWSDYATLDLIGWMARRREPARLMVIGTYRQADVQRQGHPLEAVVHDLKLHQYGEELALTLLTEPAVEQYLTARFPGTTLPDGLARLLHQRTEGNPLFMVTVVDAWEAQGWLEEVEGKLQLRMGLRELAQRVPESLRQMLAQQLDQLRGEEQQVLEAASVAGAEFSAAAVAAGLAIDVIEAEARCERLARRQQWVQSTGSDEWPDGTVAGRYAFIHALYHQVVHHQIAVARRVQLHRRIGASKEQAYGTRAGEIAAELAVHFEEGRDYGRGMQYLQRAGENALRRYAHIEAISHLTKALALLKTLPNTPERTQQELELQVALGPALIATKGRAAPEVEQTYTRARALCAQLGETPQLIPTLTGLSLFYRNRGELPTARELGEQLYRLAQRAADPTSRLEAHDALGSTLFFLGEYTAARTHLEQGIPLIDPAQRTLVLRYGEAPGVRCLGIAAWTLWCLGYPAQAVRRSQEALMLAQALAHPLSLAMAQHCAAVLHQRRREAPAVQAQADALLTLATAQGLPLFVGFGTCWRGWALAMQGRGEAGLPLLQQGLAALLATGQALVRPLCLVLLAEAAEHAGQVEEGPRLLEEALAVIEASARGDLLAEAYRLQGEFLLRQAVPDAAQAEACFHQALATARRQQAKSWELRAAVSLSRLWQRQGKQGEGYTLLAPIYGWFSEGFDTADLREAKALLEALSAGG